MNKKLSIWIYIIAFLIPILLTIIICYGLDNDLWYLLSEGRYIVNNGIYHIDPLSMHTGLQVVVQNWLSACILWIIFDVFGKMGIFTLMLICNFFICFLLYKICMLISDNNKKLSLAIMLCADIPLTLCFMTSRPQIFSFIVLLSVIYVLELYIKTGKSKYLIWIPILSFIEVNMHASLWFMIYLFTLPYIIDSIKLPGLTQGYKVKPILIAVLVSLLVSLINPYGYKALTFIFTSFGNLEMHEFIMELLPFDISYIGNQILFIVILIQIMCFALLRKGNVRLRYILLYIGTMILGFSTSKAASHFFLVSIFPFAYFFKDLFAIKETKKDSNIVSKIIITIVGIFIIFFTGYKYIKDFDSLKFSSRFAEGVDILEKYASKDDEIYTEFNYGGYLEYRGFKPYIDPRAEVFLKINNKKEDIFKEFYYLQMGQTDVTEFLDKYKFKYLVLSYSDVICKTIDNEEAYFKIYDSDENRVKIYALKELFTEEEREKLMIDIEKE